MVHLQIRQIFKTVYNVIPTRFNVAILMFLGCWFSYMLRVNMSVNLLAMVEGKPMTNGTENILPDYGVRYKWNENQQSLLLGAYFWGYFVSCLPGALLSERYGGSVVAGLTLAIGAVLTALCPVAASVGFWALWTVRFLCGLSAGPSYPAFHNIVSKWAPPEEKGKFVSALLGGTFGTVVTWPLVGIIIETMGWIWAFYIPALITGVFSIMWFLMVSNSPAVHPRISEEEKNYIEKSLGNVISKKKSNPPFLQLLMSRPFWSLMILHYGSLWGLYFLITATPKFMNSVLGFNLSKAGILSSLPHLARMIFGFIFGSIGDSIRKKQCLNVTFIRKSFTIFSHIIPGLFLIGIIFVGEHPYICVAIITLSLGFNGASTMTNLQNSQDLAPNFAASLYGAINFVATTTGFLSPLVVGFFTQENNTLTEWRYIFMVGALVYIIPAIIFILFGSGEVQKWNEVKKTDDDPENKTNNDNKD